MAPHPEVPPTAREDAALMVRVQAEDEAAFAELMQRWEVPVKSVIARIVLNASEAEDLAQETFVRLWQHRERYTPGRPFKPWLLGIAVNLARNRLRGWRRRPVVALENWLQPLPAPGTTEGGAPTLERSERENAVRDALARLPAELREAVVLFEYEQLSYAEIAETVGASVKAVENRIARGRERLRATLRAWL